MTEPICEDGHWLEAGGDRACTKCGTHVPEGEGAWFTPSGPPTVSVAMGFDAGGFYVTEARKAGRLVTDPDELAGMGIVPR
jgi:hypothetical protein